MSEIIASKTIANMRSSVYNFIYADDEYEKPVMPFRLEGYNIGVAVAWSIYQRRREKQKQNKKLMDKFFLYKDKKKKTKLMDNFFHALYSINENTMFMINYKIIFIYILSYSRMVLRFSCSKYSQFFF